MKICYVAVDVGIPYPRGASVHVHQASKFLVKAGHEVHVVCRRYSPEQQEHEMIDGFHVHRIYRGIVGPVPFSSYGGIRHSFSEMGVLRELVKGAYRLYLRSLYLLYTALYTANVIHSSSIELVFERETSQGVGALASLFTRKPLFLEIIGPEFSLLSVKYAKKIFAYPALHEGLLETGVPEDRILELFAAIDSSLFKPDLKLGHRIRRKLGLGKSPVVGYVGIFAPWHGIDTLLKASKIILNSMPETRFLMVGPYGQEYLEKASALRLADSFLFVGPVEHKSVPGYINASDVMVAPFDPSRSDVTKERGFMFIPLKILEYMGCGKPTVSTCVGNIPRIIKNGLTGIWVEPGNESELAEAILKLLRKPALARQIGRRARISVSRTYSWEKYAAFLTSAFDEALRTN